MYEKKKGDALVNAWADCVDPELKKKIRSELLVLADNLNEDLHRHISLFIDAYDKENAEECHDVGFIVRKCHEVMTALNDIGYLE